MPDDPKPESAAEDLTPEQLEALLALLDPDRERAGEIYVEIRGRLIRLYERRRCDCPEDLADETFKRVGRQLTKGAAIVNPLAYFYGVASLVYKEILRREKRKRKALEDRPPASSTLPEDPREDERLDCVRRCLARLPEDQRRLIVRYHDDDDHIRGRRELARELGIAMNALRIRAHRIRRDLEECVRSCLATPR